MKVAARIISGILAMLFITTRISYSQEKDTSHQKMQNEQQMIHHMRPDSSQMMMNKQYTKSNPMIRTGEIDLKSIDKNEDGKVYQDQMDWNIISDSAGVCPICGMKLTEVTIKQAKKNLVKHNFKVKKE